MQKAGLHTPPPPPHSVGPLHTFSGASFHDQIRFSCSRVNVFIVGHLDFIRGVGTKALTIKAEKQIRVPKIFEIYNHQTLLAFY
jgi:hypothetical protein